MVASAAYLTGNKTMAGKTLDITEIIDGVNDFAETISNTFVNTA